MTEYLKYLFECINEKDYLLAVADLRKDLLDVYDYRKTPYNHICTVRTIGDQISVE